MSKKKLLVVGSILDYSKPKVVEKILGGATVIVDNTLSFLDRKEYPYEPFNLYKYVSNPKLLLIVNAFLLFFKIPRYKIVMLNVSRNTFLFLAPLVYIYTRIFKKKFILRLIGGRYQSIYESKNGIMKSILKKTSLKADYIFAETKSNFEFFNKLNKNTHWISNCRDIKPSSEQRAPFTGKFIFMSQLKETKGVGTILEVLEQEKNVFKVDFFGPVHDEYLVEKIEQCQGACFKGLLSANEVIDTLNQYDVMLLPSYHEGEGYPGIIIECMALGIPVITTNWLSIPEMVQNDYNGKLIEPRSSSELLLAMQSINENNYQEYSSNSKKSFELFSLENVYGKMLELIDKLN